MAQLRVPRLSFSWADTPGSTVRACETCWVRLRSDDVLDILQDDLTFVLRAQLWAADSGLWGSDDHMHTFPQQKYIPEGFPPDPTVFAVFESLVSEYGLDEDAVGFDEVYAHFQLYSPGTDYFVGANSPEFWTHFD